MRTFAALVGLGCTALLAAGCQPQAACPGSTTVDQGCEPGPDGTLTGMLMLERLTESPVEVSAGGTGAGGLPLPVRTLTFTPRVVHPYGEQCGRFISAGVLLDSDGLRAV